MRAHKEDHQETRSHIRSAWASFINPVKPTHKWTRWDSIRQVRAENERLNLIADLRAQSITSNVRFAVVKKFKHHYHVVGLGTVRCEKFETLKTKLIAAGYTDIKMGGVKINL